MRWARHAARVEEMKIYNISMGLSHGKPSLGEPSFDKGNY
jgi:hypothetical protein